MDKPVAIRKGGGELLFEATQLAGIEVEPIEFRDVAVNSTSLVPGASLTPQTHDDKLEVVTAIALGETEGPIVVYTDGEDGYGVQLESYDSIVIPRGVLHTARNLCDKQVILYITNFAYVE